MFGSWPIGLLYSWINRHDYYLLGAGNVKANTEAPNVEKKRAIYWLDYVIGEDGCWL